MARMSEYGFKTLIITIALLFASISLPDFVFWQQIFLTPVYQSKEPPGTGIKRIVFIIADGLRADIALKGFFSKSGTVNMPNLKARVFDRDDSMCLVSMADAPTVSVPAHFAIFGGLSQKGLDIRQKLDTDHIMRRASNSWEIGGGDVLWAFHGTNVRSISFPDNFYLTPGPRTVLDDWTLDQFKKLLNLSNEDLELSDSLREDKNFFFLHMPGVDTEGHRHGALSKEYQDATQYFDSLIPMVEETTNSFFGDHQTTFIVTSDHGFPDFGHHGGADEECRRCPLIMWGASFLKDLEPPKTDKISIPQTDIPSILSAILGVPTPSNNQGFFPDCIPLPQTIREATLEAQYGQHVEELCSRGNAFGTRSHILGRLGDYFCAKHRLRLSSSKFDAETFKFDESLLIEAYAFCRLFPTIMLLLSVTLCCFEATSHVLFDVKMAAITFLSFSSALFWYFVVFNSWISSINFGLFLLMVGLFRWRKSLQYIRTDDAVFLTVLSGIAASCFPLTAAARYFCISMTTTLILLHLSILTGQKHRFCALIPLPWITPIYSYFAWWYLLIPFTITICFLIALKIRNQICTWNAVLESSIICLAQFGEEKLALYTLWAIYVTVQFITYKKEGKGHQESCEIIGINTGSTLSTVLHGLAILLVYLLALFPLDTFTILEFPSYYDVWTILWRVGLLVSGGASCIWKAITSAKNSECHVVSTTSTWRFCCRTVPLFLITCIITFSSMRKRQVVELWLWKSIIIALAPSLIIISVIFYERYSHGNTRELTTPV